MDTETLQHILNFFGLTFHEITGMFDTSHGVSDKRLNFILDNVYVLKINSKGNIFEERLQEINRFIERYHSSSVYCPCLIPTLQGTLSVERQWEGEEFICYVEEYVKYSVCTDDIEIDRQEMIAHLGKLAVRYSNVDLSKICSM